MSDYTITFDLSNFPESDGAVAQEAKKSSAESVDDGEMGIGDGYRAIKKATFGLVSYATVHSFADQIVSYNISQVSLETGASEYEQRLNTVYEIGNSVLGAGVSLLGGAVFGGPAGFALALTGVVLNGARKIVNIVQNNQTLQAQSDFENISIGLSRRRAGFTGSRSINQ